MPYLEVKVEEEVTVRVGVLIPELASTHLYVSIERGHSAIERHEQVSSERIRGGMYDLDLRSCREYEWCSFSCYCRSRGGNESGWCEVWLPQCLSSYASEV